MMIGRSVADYFPQHLSAKLGVPVIEVSGLSSPGKFAYISFSVRTGEILGFAGLVGSGRSEIARAIFGLDSRAEGTVAIDGRRLSLGSVQRSLAAGVGLVPEDRKRQGCVQGMPCRANISMAVLDRIRRLGLLLDRSREAVIATDYFSRLKVKAASLDAPVNSLSGGNQQKVVIAKWLARGGRVLIVDAPIRLFSADIVKLEQLIAQRRN